MKEKLLPSEQSQNKLKINDHYPHEGDQVYFHAALVTARSIEKHNKPVKGSGSHRTQMARVDDGLLYIEKSWSIKKK